jgi:L-ascorbate metabolism protein UlaG (beta-lactamase superfamily)
MLWTIIGIIAILVFLIPPLIGYAFSEKGYHGPVSDHFDGRRFFNYGKQERTSYTSVIRWLISRRRGPWVDQSKSIPGTIRPLPRVGDKIRITHVNHSTFLIQCDDKNILTDPVWSQRASPFKFSGPKRMIQPGIAFDDLPSIDYVLLSHNHYDHLDLDTLKKLIDIYDPVIVTGLGVGQLLKKHGMHSVCEVDWWDTVQLQGTMVVQGLPAHHSSARGTFDRDKTLWCGFSLVTSSGKIYFAGDTGYDQSTFKMIGDRSGPFTVSLIPIGAYKPGWLMSPVHCSPQDALQIHFDVQSKQSIACHFGTFPLGDESQTDPETDLQYALNKKNVPSKSFIVPRAGVPIDIRTSDE